MNRRTTDACWSGRSAPVAAAFLLATLFSTLVPAQEQPQVASRRDVTQPSGHLIYVVGAVEKPGGYDAPQLFQADGREVKGRAGMTLSQALALAGGLAATAKPRSAKVIRRRADGSLFEIPIDLDEVLKRDEIDLELRQGDILFVPDSRNPGRRLGPWDPPSTLPLPEPPNPSPS